MCASTATVFDIIERGCDTDPNGVALAYAGSAWTWPQLHERVLRLAGGLEAAGVAAGDRVLVLDKNHPACLEVTFAASLIGAVNTAISFRLSGEELIYVVNDSTAEVLIVGQEFLESIAAIRPQLPRVRRVIVLGGDDDEYEALIADSVLLGQRRPSSPDDCFLQLYTSGTTGWPKGAVLTQRGVEAHSQASAQAYRMDSDTVNLVAMPLFHVGGTCWALASMHAGGRTILARDASPTQTLALIIDQGITHAFLVPAVIQMMLDQAGVAESLNQLKVLGYGGSPMPAPLMQRVLTETKAQMFSVYGMTELSGVICVLGPEEHRDESRTQLRASVGRPVPGVEVRVVDPGTFQDVPVGAVGEFWVRSEQVMQGYWNQPQATAETIVDGWMRTGDAGRMDTDGCFYIEDRVKDMVISGGENIYPAEVERVLLKHPCVAEAAVIGVSDNKWGETVHAVVVPKSDSTIDPEDLIMFARDRLAHYKCPTGVTVVDALPRNPTGKVLKRQLRVTVA